MQNFLDEYKKAFSNALRGNQTARGEALMMGELDKTGACILPLDYKKRFENEIERYNLFRRCATVITATDEQYSLLSEEAESKIDWVPECGTIKVYDGTDIFSKIKVNSWKLTSIIKFDELLVNTKLFKFEDYLLSRLAREFGREEENGFINGNGEVDSMPTGILNDKNGAQLGATSQTTVTYDDIINLYHSVKPEYRKFGVWIMNDETALMLKKLKDSNGNYLWNSNDETLLGKPVVYSESMPNCESGNKPIAFGDLSYYWVIIRSKFAIKILTELFNDKQQYGYNPIEFIDGRLMKREAIKVLKID